MILLKLYFAFFKIGLLGFGGGMAIIQLIYDSIQSFTSMSASQFADIVAIAQVTPGPIAVNSATYVGYETAGYAGAALATLGVATPAFIIVAIVCRAVEKFRESTAVKGALEGIRPATVGLIAAAMLTLGEPSFFAEKPLGANFSALAGASAGGIDWIAVAICAATVLLIGRYKKNPFAVLILMGCIGAVLGV